MRAENGSRDRRPYRMPAARDLARMGLRSGGSVRLRVSGDSMLPLLRPGDAVRLQPAEPASLRRGQLVVLAIDGHLLTHRLLWQGPEGLVAKGDNREALDPPASPDSLVGRVIAIERGGRHLDLDRGAWCRIEPLLGWLASCEAHPDGWLQRLAPLHLPRLLRRLTQGALGTALRWLPVGSAHEPG